jgi:hypothetical protein
MLALIASLSAGLVAGTAGAFARDRDNNDHSHQTDNKDKKTDKKKVDKKKVDKKKDTTYQCVTQPCGPQSSSTTTNTQRQGTGGTRAMNTAQGRSAATGNTGNTITISNGRTKVTIPAGTGGLTVSSNKKDGTITVFNGVETRTLRGGSVVVSGAGVQSGAVYTQNTPDTESKRNAQGEMVFAIKP